MEHWKNRSELLLGHAAMARLARARVAVFGLGGVGGHAAEALARGGVEMCIRDRMGPRWKI